MRRGFVLPVAAVLILGSCSWSDEPSKAVDQPGPYAAEQAAWSQAGIDSYRIDFSIRNLNGMGGSHGDGRFQVTVQDNNRTECSAESAFEPSSGFCDGAADPVSYLFSRLAMFNPDHTVAVFDPELRFPISIEYDEPDVADEEYSIRVHEFEVLQEP